MSAEGYDPTDQMAASPDEGGLVALTERDWPDRGEEPDSDEVFSYRNNDEPLAETDNWWNTNQRENDKRLNYALGSLADRIDAIASDFDDHVADFEDHVAEFRNHNHDSRYYLKSQTYSTSQARDRFVNTNKPNSIEKMDGPLQTPYVRSAGGDYFVLDGRGSYPTLKGVLDEGSDSPTESEISLRYNGWGVDGDTIATHPWVNGNYVNEDGDTMSGPLSTPSIDATEADLGGEDGVVVEGNDGNRIAFTPRFNGVLEDKPLLYSGQWDIKGSPKAGGDTIATQPWTDNNYLALDTSNDPLTGALTLEITDNDDGWEFTTPNGNPAIVPYIGGEGEYDNSLEYRTPNNGLSHWRFQDFVRFEGGSTYWGTTDDDDMDTYDAVWEMGDGTDFRIHAKENPNGLPDSLNGKFATLFTTDDGRAISAYNLENKTTYNHELRNIDDGGTPLATGDDNLSEKSDVGDAWFTPDGGNGQLRIKGFNGAVGIVEVNWQ